MPSSINGIGTTYYGKKDRHAHFGVCEACNANTELSSYETRLWFIVLFIPIIPLGKRQILDYCPSCTRHRAVPLGEWQRLSNDAIRDVMEKAKQSPDNPESAMEMHGTLAAFQRHEEAAKYAEIMMNNFPNNCDMHLYLGSWHARAGRTSEADACFDRALELDPANHAAARAVAIACIENGDLQRAKQLLAFMEAPGPEQDPTVLLMLADAYNAQGDSENAKHYYRIALAAAPEFARDKKLRKRIAALEAGGGTPQPILPQKPARSGKKGWLLAAVGVVALAMLLNYFMASRQTLHVVNRLPDRVTVVIDGKGPGVTLGPNRETITVSEGEHQAQITRTDGSVETVDFEIANGFGQRYFGNNAFVLNVAGAADFLWEQTVYSENPDPNAVEPYEIKFGQEFLVMRGIDYKFEEFPAQLQMESSRVTKTRLSVVDAAPLNVMMSFPEGTPPGTLLDYAEHHLSLDHTNEFLLKFYFLIGLGQEQNDRCQAFLEAGLDRKPVAVEWHRTYQEMAETADDENRMIARYDKLLAENADDSALLYLRGRLAPGALESQQYIDRAIAADPQNPYPYLATSYHLVSKGRLDEAREALAKASELKPDDLQLAAALLDVRFALAEYSELEREQREALDADPLDLASQQTLLQVLVAEGRLPEAEEAHSALVEAAGEAGFEDDAPLPLQSLGILQYLTGDLKGWLETSQKADTDQTPNSGVAVAPFELGHLDEAEQSLVESAVVPKGYAALLLSLAWKQLGDDEKAESWWQSAIDTFAAGKLDENLIADTLRKGDQLQLDEVDDLSTQRPLKAVLLVALADRAPALRTALLERAETLNCLGPFPYQFLRRTIEMMKD